MRYILSLLLFMAGASLGYTQQLSLPSTSAGSATATQPTFNLSYTVGESGTGTLSQTSVILTAGFQQSDPSGIPLNAVSFDISARWEGPNAKVHTSVHSDLSFVQWELERASQSEAFAKIATTDAPASNDFTWEDTPENTSQSWHYRLRVLDAEGRSWYSPTVELTPSSNPLRARLYPNPTSTEAFLSYHLEQAARLQLVDANGKRLRNMELSAGDAVRRIAVNDLAAGSYFLLLTSGEYQKRFSLIVNK
jgi:hypothetical protein